MKIHVKTDEENFRVELPFGLHFEKAAPPVVARTVGQITMDVSTGQALKLVNAIRSYKKDHPDWHPMGIRKAKSGE